MGAKSSIEWTESTWNPVTGCTKISPGCDHCYAERLAIRLQAMGQPNYATGFKLTVQEHMLELPLRWKTPQIIFVNSMSDLFHRDVPTEYIHRVFDVMKRAHWHRFQVLTKRSLRLSRLSPTLDWHPNIWMGVSVESKDYTFRINHLRDTGAHIKFLSLEPLLGPLSNLNLQGINWAIVGGESGPHARRMQQEWVIEIRNQCQSANVPFFFKQWGGTNKKKAGRVLENQTWDEMPRATAVA
ncbi:MAG: phage Gp37/Gp68 family protein [Acidobacteria bacterium]|nr:phage Gp37/Gp68 family protein [Acidobacteriota bacterium]